MTARDLAIKHLQGDLTETQLTYWLHINAIPEDEFNKEVQNIVAAEQCKSLGCLVMVIGVIIFVIILLGN